MKNENPLCSLYIHTLYVCKPAHYTIRDGVQDWNPRKFFPCGLMCVLKAELAGNALLHPTFNRAEATPKNFSY